MFVIKLTAMGLILAGLPLIAAAQSNSYTGSLYDNPKSSLPQAPQPDALPEPPQSTPNQNDPNLSNSGGGQESIIPNDTPPSLTSSQQQNVQDLNDVNNAAQQQNSGQ